jgi:hypothetical protein
MSDKQVKIKLYKIAYMKRVTLFVLFTNFLFQLNGQISCLKISKEDPQYKFYFSTINDSLGYITIDQLFYILGQYSFSNDSLFFDETKEKIYIRKDYYLSNSKNDFLTQDSIIISLRNCNYINGLVSTYPNAYYVFEGVKYPIIQYENDAFHRIRAKRPISKYFQIEFYNQNDVLINTFEFFLDEKYNSIDLEAYELNTYYLDENKDIIELFTNNVFLKDKKYVFQVNLLKEDEREY